MPSIHIHRDHALGIERARAIAAAWADQARDRLAMQCVRREGAGRDTIEFSRSGCTGTLIVGADHFTLDAKLGLLLGPFAKRIESEIEGNLDRLLANDGSRSA